MKLILALALGATAQFATPALRGGARRLEALELLGAEESAKVEAEQEAARATALAEAMAQLKEAQDMMAKAEALKAAAATAEAAPEAPKEPEAPVFTVTMKSEASKANVRAGVPGARRDGASPRLTVCRRVCLASRSC